jgi:phospholipid/cholesterol/gamma-HCH transport system substrate-binding protein
MGRFGRFSTAAKVGVFAVVTIVAGILIYRFVNKTTGAQGGYRVYALFRDASGVAKLSQVRIAGIPIGSVESIKLQKDKARVDIRIKPDVALYDDATAAKVASSLLGEYYLTLTPGTEGKRKLEDGDQIKIVIEATTPDDIMKDLQKIAQDVKKVSEALAATVGSDAGKDDIRETLHNLAQVTEALNDTVRANRDRIDNILVNVENITGRSGPEIERILENVRETTREVRELVEKPPDGTDERAGEVRQIVDRVNRASQNLENALQNIETVSERLEKGEGTLGRLTKDEKLINEVEGVAESVNDFIGGLNRVQTIIVLRMDYQFLSSGVKSYVELRLQPREDKYYMIQVVNDPRGATRFEQVDVDTTNPNEPPHYREVRTVTTNQLRFSLQFAQSFGPFTGRFGIMESTGGVGLDVLLFEDRFELKQDLFGFGEVVVPRWRISLGYEFVNRLWLLGGVDHILSGTQRDYFIGAQLKFNDEDLKSILPFTPGPGGGL